MSAEKRLKELNIDLGTVSAPVANYVNAVRTGTSSTSPARARGRSRRPAPKGKVGRDYTVEQAYQHARTVGLDLLAVMRPSSAASTR